jgi:hypothetical protein
MKGQHLRMTLRQGRGLFRAVAWRAAEYQEFYRLHRSALSIAFSLSENTYRGVTSIELNVTDVK